MNSSLAAGTSKIQTLNFTTYTNRHSLIIIGVQSVRCVAASPVCSTCRGVKKMKQGIEKVKMVHILNLSGAAKKLTTLCAPRRSLCCGRLSLANCCVCRTSPQRAFGMLIRTAGVRLCFQTSAEQSEITLTTSLCVYCSFSF